MNIAKQCKTVSNFIEEHGEISQRDAYLLGVYRLSARIFDLKASGRNVTTSMREVTNSDGSVSRVAFYSFGEV